MSKKGFQMSVSTMIALVLGVLFVAAIWASLSGHFNESVNAANNLSGAVA